MKKHLKTYTLKWLVIIIALCGLVAMDMAFTNKQTVMPGSFIADSLLTQKPAPETSVSIIISDNKELKQPLSVTSSELSYAQVKDMVKQAIDLVGGIKKYVKAGDTVLIKPNIVGADRPTAVGENTDVRVIKAIMQLINEAYSNKCMIYIGEGSARTLEAFGGSLFGNTQYADTCLRKDPDLKGIRFELVDLNDMDAKGKNCVYAPSKFKLAYRQQGRYWVHKFVVSKNIKFINVPVLKMHEPGLTNAIKNMFGIGAGYYYGCSKSSNKGEGDFELVHNKEFTAEFNYKSWIDEDAVDLYSVVDKIDLNVVDALLCLENSKSFNKEVNNQVRLNSIVAGEDAVAVDYVCTKMIGSNPDDIEHITLSAKIGLGTNDPTKITIKGDKVSRFNYQFKRGSMHSQYGQGNRVWLVSEATPYTSNEPPSARSAYLVDPTRSGIKWSAPIYFLDDRIDLNSFLNPQGSVVAYCFTNVYVPTAKQNVEMWVNSEEDMLVYLNDSLVYNYSGSRPNANLVSDKPLINLKADENKLLVKVLQTSGCYDFSLNICEPGTNGNRVNGLKFYCKGYNEAVELKK